MRLLAARSKTMLTGVLRTHWNGCARDGVLLETSVLATSLALAPAAHAERWHDGDRHHNHHGGGNAAGAAIASAVRKRTLSAMMPDQQKQVADQLFRANTEKQARRAMQMHHAPNG